MSHKEILKKCFLKVHLKPEDVRGQLQAPGSCIAGPTTLNTGTNTTDLGPPPTYDLCKEHI